MMELWEACFFVLILDLTFGKDIPSNETYVIRKIDSCPDVGYFFKREPSPNLVVAGPCYLCFCNDNGTATCWERERRRCDVERYHHHRVGRQSRYRRSFSDVFFRDASRDFFGKNLPQQCKPFESSFSDGCPPADWCIGCTICDCDSNGRWDCHILSFCDGKESKKKIKPLKNHRKKTGKKSLDYDTSIDVKPTKRTPTRKTSKKTATKPKTSKPPKKNFRKVVKANPGNKTYARTNKTTTDSKIKQQASRKVPRRAQTKALSRNHPKNNVTRVKIIKKVVATRKPVTLNRNAVNGLKLNPNSSDTVKLGQKIVKQVMTTFKKVFAREMGKLNETKRNKLKDGKDCGGVKKRDKRTYNIRSKAVARNKNKYNRHAMLKENYTNARIKREILNEKQANVEQISVITLTTDANAVIPLVSARERNSSSTNPPDSISSVPLFTSRQDNYYEYSIKNDSDWSSRTESTKKMTKNNETNIENNGTVPVGSNNDIELDISKNNGTKIMNPDFNDLKFSKWYMIRIKNDERKKAVTRLVLPKPSMTKTFEYGQKMDEEYYSTNLQTKNLEPKLAVTTKYNLTSLISTAYERPCCTKSPKNYNRTNIISLKNIIQSLFSSVNKTDATKRKQKSKISVLKYVRKIFRNIFSKKKSKFRSHKVYGLGSKEDQTLQILCENVGHCNINKNSRMILKYKLNRLNKETETVLKSIRIVKGLLHLLELPDNDKTSHMTKNSYFQNDIQKLGTILKDYKDDEMNFLTFSQKMQINYIKKNTQTFLESIKKFADILTDILAIIKPSIEYDHSLKSSPQQQNYTSSSLNKIKKLLHRYNIMQNTFMRRMYGLINGEEEKGSTTEIAQTLESDRNQNISDNNMIEKYSKKIIENLRKLKTIAQLLSSPKRKKRELMMRDDALEYLLALMEILIRKNHHLYTVPANDGIDLLIDAIKNVPDIKPTNKKGPDYAPMIPFKQDHIIEKSNQIAGDSNSDSQRTSNEDNTTDPDGNLISQDNVVSRTSVVSHNNVLTDTNSKPETLKLETIDDDYVTQKVYYRVFNQLNNNEYDKTEYNGITKHRSQEELEKKGFDKFESYLGDPKKLELDAVYVESDVIGDITTENTPMTVNNPDATGRTIEDHTVHNVKATGRTTAYVASANDSSSESQDLMNDKRSKLEWIEETFDREIRMINNVSSFTPTLTTSMQTTQISIAKKIENNSDLTKEELSEKSLRRTAKKKTTPKDVLYEKQIQFLNSLDYGTEKSADLEESESKDDARSDDSFPAYFV